MSVYRRHLTLAVLLALVCAPVLQAATLVQQLSMQDLCDRAGLIIRGTVLEITPGSINVGGGELPIVTYRIKVDEDFLGNVSIEKGVRIAEISMVGNLKNADSGTLTHFSALPDLPQLRIGGEYLLLTTPPSAAGLSSTVGLGQGCFSITYQDKEAMAVNELGNAGLFNGPVAYADLADQIRSAITQ